MKGIQAIECQQCGKPVLRRGKARYCLACSKERSTTRKLEYYHSRRKDDGYLARQAERSKMASAELRDVFLPAAGRERSLARGMAEPFEEPDLNWLCRINIPFTGAASKNHVYGIGGWHVYKRQNVNQFQQEVEALARQALAQSGIKPVQNKVWMAIHVEKPNHRFDAINVVDSIADGLKKALEIDDRWFAIRRLDWSINKRNPCIIIDFGQESDIHSKICSYCGIIQPMENFGPCKGQPSGRHRICTACNDLAKALRRQRREDRTAAVAGAGT